MSVIAVLNFTVSRISRLLSLYSLLKIFGRFERQNQAPDSLMLLSDIVYFLVEQQNIHHGKIIGEIHS